MSCSPSPALSALSNFLVDCPRLSLSTRIGASLALSMICDIMEYTQGIFLYALLKYVAYSSLAYTHSPLLLNTQAGAGMPNSFFLMPSDLIPFSISITVPPFCFPNIDNLNKICKIYAICLYKHKIPLQTYRHHFMVSYGVNTVIKVVYGLVYGFSGLVLIPAV